VVLARGTRRMCFNETVAMYNCGMVFTHRSVAWCWNSFTATRVFWRSTLQNMDWLGKGPVVPGLPFVLAWRRRLLL
jgi:hypothetical protein